MELEAMKPAGWISNIFKNGTNWLFVTANCVMLYMCVSAVKETAEQQLSSIVITESATDGIRDSLKELDAVLGRVNTFAELQVQSLDKFNVLVNSLAEDIYYFLDKRDKKDNAPNHNGENNFTSCSFRKVSMDEDLDVELEGAGFFDAQYKNSFKFNFLKLFLAMRTYLNKESPRFHKLNENDSNTVCALFCVQLLDIYYQALDLGIEKIPQSMGVHLSLDLAFAQFEDILEIREKIMETYREEYTPCKLIA